ncbi:MAG TPA: FMN-binding negative transcriptional regulator [Novimethylophilus sp.]|jgi:transcriptional regulator|uniref:FMN-binding negative transcriptional regulator n=1 Tax=Novimethylophilus sp. TaxID=2137426 RepID=UPI002F3F0D15
MYIPKYFNEDDGERLYALIESHSFGMLATVEHGLPYISHLPFLYEKHGAHGKLIGHLARANPQWQHLAQEQKVLVVFQGPHTYVSPSWYAAPGVPTWNYAVVHLYGTAKIIQDEARVIGIVEKLTEKYEANAPNPWQPRLKEGDSARMLGMIAGFEIEVTEIQGKFKLSQNRSIEDRRGVVGHLSQSDSVADREVAALMQAYFNE